MEFWEALIEALARRAGVEGTGELGTVEVETLPENSTTLDVDWDGELEEGVEESTR